MKPVQGLPYKLPDLLTIALEQLDADDLISAYQFSDRACRLSDVPDANALIVRATILSKRGCLTEAIADLKTANLLMPGNHNIAYSLLRLCWSDLENYRDIFKKSLVSLLRQTPKASLNPEMTAWIAGSGLSALGAAWSEDGFVTGWAVNTYDPQSSLLIELDGGFSSVETGMPTPWLLAAGLGNGFNGFRLQLPDSFSLLRVGISSISLWGCPFIGKAKLIPQSPSPLQLSNTVDIIVPVYSGREETLACLDSIKASSNRTPYRVLVIDDCSPDETLRQALKERAQRNEITLACRPINAGFAGAVNTVLSLDDTRDVVLLNADTLVFTDWLDRMRTIAYQDDDIATVTPLSNHAELLSYPAPMCNNFVDNERHAERIDQLFKAIGPKAALNIPVGVGFCFYIKRQALNEVGLLDEGTFGRGYGEDTDFCLRLQAQGWRNVCAANTYVVHWGSRSFGEEKKHLVAQNLHRLHAKYPSHSKEYDQFLDDDPLYPLRRFAQRRWLAEVAPPFRGILRLGIPKPEDGICFTLIPKETHPGSWQVTLKVSGVTGLDTIDYDWPKQATELREDLLAAGFKSIEIKTFGECPSDMFDQLTDGFIPYTLRLEDYSGYCPRKYRLIRNAVLCNDPSGTKECSLCISELGPLVYDYKDMELWQERTKRVLAKANKVSAISDEIRQAYIRRFPTLRKRMAKIETALKSPPVLRLPDKPRIPLRIAVLSARSVDEGYFQLVEQANKALKLKLGVEFIVFGKTLNDALIQQLPNTHLIGEIPKAQLQDGLRLHACNAIANFSPCEHIRRCIAKTAQQNDLPLIQSLKAA